MCSSRRRSIPASVPMPESRLQTRPIAVATVLAGMINPEWKVEIVVTAAA